MSETNEAPKLAGRVGLPHIEPEVTKTTATTDGSTDNKKEGK